jgi:hypothetical protein
LLFLAAPPPGMTRRGKRITPDDSVISMRLLSCQDASAGAQWKG